MTTLKIPVGPEDHAQGPADAPVTLVEYGDYQCPSCGSAYPIVKRLQKHFGNRLRFVFRNFPLTQIHPNAEPAAEAAEFAATHNEFWEMHDLLYENQDRLGGPLFTAIAEKLRLPTDALAESLNSHQFLPRIRADFSGGVRSGVNGTPTFFINNHRHEASYDFKTLSAAIEDGITHNPKSASA